MKFRKKISLFFKTLSLEAPYFSGRQEFEKSINILIESNSNFALDLGSGPNPRNPSKAKQVKGVDIRAHDKNNVFKCNLAAETLPFPSKFFNVITAYDLLEHIPRVACGPQMSFPLVDLFNEVWRVLDCGGFFFSLTPCYPMDSVFQDPTHVNLMTEKTIKYYFTGKNWARIYGFVGSFEIMHEGWLGGKYFCLLKKSEERPIDDLDGVQES